MFCRFSIVLPFWGKCHFQSFGLQYKFVVLITSILFKHQQISANPLSTFKFSDLNGSTLQTLLFLVIQNFQLYLLKHFIIYRYIKSSNVIKCNNYWFVFYSKSLQKSIGTNYMYTSKSKSYKLFVWIQSDFFLDIKSTVRQKWEISSTLSNILDERINFFWTVINLFKPVINQNYSSFSPIVLSHGRKCAI